ncbi:hypothetical protein D0Z07_0805 [Hyphodiscus hymeniophilus]|uniref:DUF5672 domain-containing protein n=1 Tax=Hyphodiscus hymeniophilus TaxID=353542 RepID=A0A9P7B076_9HELO|nr:hypothetical protein D0Z07_0805 [Hyphodiscus hymeniophilus]
MYSVKGPFLITKTLGAFHIKHARPQIVPVRQPAEIGKVSRRGHFPLDLDLRTRIRSSSTSLHHAHIAIMKGRPVIIATILCAGIFILSTYWWRTTSDDGNLRSLSNLLAPITGHSDTVAVRDNVAVIIETRPLRTLIPLILHFATVLGPGWPIYFFTRPSTVHTLAAFGGGSQPFQRMVKSGQIKIIELPSEPYLGNYLGISHFIASEWFWMRLEPAKKMLMFQTDSILCANSGRRIEDYLDYDFVGAAHPYILEAFNGGLSIRNVSLSLEIVRAHAIADDVVNGTNLGLFEDVWFCDKMKKMGARFPSREIASEFAVDFEWAERPMGYHGVGKGQHDDRLEDIYAWCPEAVFAKDQLVADLSEEEQKQNSTSYPKDGETLGGDTLQFG